MKSYPLQRSYPPHNLTTLLVKTHATLTRSTNMADYQTICGVHPFWIIHWAIYNGVYVLWKCKITMQKVCIKKHILKFVQTDTCWDSSLTHLHKQLVSSVLWAESRVCRLVSLEGLLTPGNDNTILKRYLNQQIYSGTHFVVKIYKK